MWRYAELPHVFGAPPERYHARRVTTADELAPALADATKAQAAGRLALVEVVTPRLDVPQGALWMHRGSFIDVEQQSSSGGGGGCNEKKKKH
jgi:TPP-dependent 2-oxoacid decarboxylase